MIGVFVDGSYLWQAWRALSSSYVEYAQLLRLIKDRCSDPAAVAYYFDARHPRVDCERRERVLRRAGFRVRTNYPVVQEIARGADGRTIIDPATGKPLILERQKGVDVGLALEITRSLQRDRWTQLVLIAGDADFAELVQELVEQHCINVTIVGSGTSISSALLPYAQQIIDLKEVASELNLLSRKPAA